MVDESSPHLEILQGADTHEEDMARRIQDRGRVACLLLLLLGLSIYSNIYQLRQPKEPPSILAVNQHGEVVPHLLLKPDEIPVDDDMRVAIAHRVIEDWVRNARARSLDKDVTAANINSVLRLSAGPARKELAALITKEDVWARIKKETVQVQMPKSPVHLIGQTWQAEWQELVKEPQRTDGQWRSWSINLQLADGAIQPTKKNPFGVGVVGWTEPELLSR